jgi:transmembrane sensor
MTLTPERLQWHIRAADYFARRREADWTGADERELDAWLAADPQHRSAFESLGRTVLDLQQVRRPVLAGDAPAVPQARADGPRAHLHAGTPPRRPTRRAFVPVLLSAALVATVALGGGWYAWDHHASLVSEIATGPGEVREAELPDGTRVTLNFSSRLTVRYYPRRRETVLDQGEAFF